MENCADCRFQMFGQCRRYAPRARVDIVRLEIADHPQWPEVKIYEDGCGDFEPITPAPPTKEFPIKPTKDDPCPGCLSHDGKIFMAERPWSECASCGATDEIPF